MNCLNLRFNPLWAGDLKNKHTSNVMKGVSFLHHMYEERVIERQREREKERDREREREREISDKQT